MIESPWLPFEWDVNNDGFFTISDVVLWLQQLFFMPGDWVIWLSLQYFPDASRFFELSTRAYGSTFSALISLVAWILIIVCVMMMTHYLAAVDRAFTSFVRRIASAFLIKFRIAKRLAAEWFTRRRAARRDRRSIVEDLGLSPEELRILSAHAHVSPPDTLALSDLVRATGVPRVQAKEVLARLQELQLLAFADGQQMEEGGYLLTPPGHKVVQAVKRSVSSDNSRQ